MKMMRRKITITMNLREEIIDILKDVYYNNDQADQFDENDADRIIKLFEKRIDERIKHYESGGIVEYSNNLEIIIELQNLKEMLK